MKASDKQVAGTHYSQFSIQPSEFIHRNGIGFLEGNVIKYVCRHKNKNGRQDIEKAIHYLQLLLEWEYPESAAVDGDKFFAEKDRMWVTAEWAKRHGYAP